jgi:hypothetical protein
VFGYRNSIHKKFNALVIGPVGNGNLLMATMLERTSTVWKRPARSHPMFGSYDSPGYLT